MNLEDLLNGLKADDATTRLQAARIIGLLDETLALDALAARYRVENVGEVRAAIAWAGKRVQAARQAGYTTLDAIFKHFHIEYEIENQEDEREAELLRKMQLDMDMQLLRERSGKAGNAALGAAIGGVLMGAQGMIDRRDVGINARRGCPVVRPGGAPADRQTPCAAHPPWRRRHPADRAPPAGRPQPGQTPQGRH